MEKLLEMLATNPFILVLLSIVVLAIIVVVIIILLRGGAIKSKWFELGGAAPGKTKRTLQETEKLVSLEGKKFDNIINSNFKEILKIKEKFREENRKRLSGSIKRTLSSITLKYTEKILDDTLYEDKSKLLELYLKRDLHTIMSEKLEEIRKTNENHITHKEEILSNIPKYTEDIMIGIKEAAYKFDLIDPKSELLELLSESKIIIKETLEDTIKQFINLNEKEQDEIVEIVNLRKEQICQELSNLLEE